MAIKRKLKVATKTTGKKAEKLTAKAAAKKSQIKAVAKKPLNKSKPKENLKPAAQSPYLQAKPTPQAPKVHPFANFMQAKNSYRPGAPSGQKFSPHELYRKKAV